MMDDWWTFGFNLIYTADNFNEDGVDDDSNNGDGDTVNTSKVLQLSGYSRVILTRRYFLQEARF